MVYTGKLPSQDGSRAVIGTRPSMSEIESVSGVLRLSSLEQKEYQRCPLNEIFLLGFQILLERRLCRGVAQISSDGITTKGQNWS